MNKDYLIYKLSDEVKTSCKIDTGLFQKYGVKRGLRNEDGSGVLATACRHIAGRRRIIRPAYKNVLDVKEYTPLSER